MNKIILGAGAAALAVSLAHNANAAVYFDLNLAVPDWSVTMITNANAAGSSFSSTAPLIGGAPGQHRLIAHNLIATGPNATMATMHMRNGAFYNPATQGAITSIYYAEDSINFVGGQAGDGQGSGMAILQNGSFYMMRTSIITMPFITHSNWVSAGVSGLVATDFWEFDNAGNLISSSNPDFSATGSVMQLGFWRGNSSNGNINTEAGLDNWYVDIRAVPAPGTLALLGLTTLATTRRRR